MLNGEVLKRYYVSFGSNVNELSGVRVPMINNKIENSYDKFVLNLKEIK